VPARFYRYRDYPFLITHIHPFIVQQDQKKMKKDTEIEANYLTEYSDSKLYSR
jgi:hypothetical protein